MRSAVWSAMQSSAVVLPNSIRELITYAARELCPDRIVLFGSRARGDALEASDFDLAFVLNDETKKKWPRFLADVGELPLTLRRVDYVAWHEANDDLRKQILAEGITVYEAPV